MRLSNYSGEVLTATLTDKFVEARKFLPAFLLAGTDGAGEQAWLPLELRRVLQLPEMRRSCFVLRVLEAWPREECAAALGIPAQTVDEELCAAAECLALLAKGK